MNGAIDPPPVVNIRVRFDGTLPKTHLWVAGRPLEPAEWETAKKAIDSVISTYGAEFIETGRQRRGEAGGQE